MTNSFYAIYILIHVVFQPAHLPQHEIVAIHGIYKVEKECTDQFIYLSKEASATEKYGCIMVVHPEDDRRLEEERMRRHQEGSRGMRP